MTPIPIPAPAPVPASIICTVDVVLLTLQQGRLRVALLRRDHDPFKGVLALPGGYVQAENDADAHHAALRMLRDKTAIAAPYLEQLATFSGRGRDPRGWSVSIAHYALVPLEVIQAANHPQVALTLCDRLPSLPFDHAHIIECAVARVRNKSSYSSLPVYLCGEPLTLPRLQSVYEAVTGEPINKVSFRRKMEELDMLEPVEGEYETGKANRPAQRYRLKARFRERLALSDRALNPG